MMLALNCDYENSKSSKNLKSQKSLKKIKIIESRTGLNYQISDG